MRRSHLPLETYSYSDLAALYTRISSLEEQLRDPNSKTSVYSLLDVLTALIADCDHANIKRIKAIEAFTSRCK